MESNVYVRILVECDKMDYVGEYIVEDVVKLKKLINVSKNKMKFYDAEYGEVVKLINYKVTKRNIADWLDDIRDLYYSLI